MNITKYLLRVGLGCCGKELVMQETLSTLSLEKRNLRFLELFWMGHIPCCNSHMSWWFVIDGVLYSIFCLPLFYVVIFYTEHEPFLFFLWRSRELMQVVPATGSFVLLQWMSLALLVSFSWSGPVPMSQTFVSLLTRRIIHIQVFWTTLKQACKCYCLL